MAANTDILDIIGVFISVSISGFFLTPHQPIDDNRAVSH